MNAWIVAGLWFVGWAFAMIGWWMETRSRRWIYERYCEERWSRAVLEQQLNRQRMERLMRSRQEQMWGRN